MKRWTPKAGVTAIVLLLAAFLLVATISAASGPPLEKRTIKLTSVGTSVRYKDVPPLGYNEKKALFNPSKGDSEIVKGVLRNARPSSASRKGPLLEQASSAWSSATRRSRSSRTR